MPEPVIKTAKELLGSDEVRPSDFKPTPEYQNALSMPVGLERYLSLDIPKDDWMIQGLWNKPEAILLSSGTGVGKSLVTAIFAKHMALGEDILGLSVPKPRKLLIIDGEMHPRQNQKRFNRMNLSVNELAICQKNLHFWNSKYAEGFPVINDEESLTALWNILNPKHHSEPYDGVIVDNLFACSSMVDYNKPNEYQQLYHNLIEPLLSWNISVYLVDHTNKGGDFYGSKVKEAFMDNTMKLSKYEDVYTLKICKGRDMEIKGDEIEFMVDEKNRLLDASGLIPNGSKKHLEQFKENRWDEYCMANQGVSKTKIAQGFIDKFLDIAQVDESPINVRTITNHWNFPTNNVQSHK